MTEPEFNHILPGFVSSAQRRGSPGTWHKVFAGWRRSKYFMTCSRVHPIVGLRFYHTLDVVLRIRNDDQVVIMLRISAHLFHSQRFNKLISTGASARIDLPIMHPVFPENLAAQRRRSAAGVSPSDESNCWAEDFMFIFHFHFHFLFNKILSTALDPSSLHLFGKVLFAMSQYSFAFI